MKHYYAVIDTNVLVSAASKWESVPGSILDLAFAGVIVPCLNDEILDEYWEVLSREKSHFPKETVEDIINGIRLHSVFLNPKESEEKLPDPGDRIFYEITMAGKDTQDTYLVTGNRKHFPKHEYVVSPRQMLDIVLQGANEE